MEDNIKQRPSYLSPKHFKFCELYIQTNNASYSARQAGYSEKTSGVAGHQLLKNNKVQRYLQERQSDLIRQENELIASSNEVMEYFTKVMRGQPDEQGKRPGYMVRNQAAQELAKRLVDNNESTGTPVQIVVDIPRPTTEPKKRGRKKKNEQ